MGCRWLTSAPNKFHSGREAHQMSVPSIIECSNLSKHYELGLIDHKTLGNSVRNWIERWKFNPTTVAHENPTPSAEPPPTTVLELQPTNIQILKALDDVSFSIQPGDALGVIGSNGSGKSTLLKIISRVTLPTSGSVAVRGRVLSMLEIGTGFHPELSGRDNVYMNGMILGMSKLEIKEKYHQIVDFAELKSFMDTPVKRYSSGMHLRLAFSVAVHFEPEIMIIDEVLAVGDAAFQKKCVSKMEGAIQDGRTILFVSHNMSMVQKLCNKGLYLKKGRVEQLGSASDALEAYEKESGGQSFLLSAAYSAPSGEQSDSGFVELTDAKLMDLDGTSCDIFDRVDSLLVQATFNVFRHGMEPSKPAIGLYRNDNTCVFVVPADDVLIAQIGTYCIECTIPGSLLNDGTYFVALGVFENADGTNHPSVWVEKALSFKVGHDLQTGTNALSIGQGVTYPDRFLSWQKKLL